MITQINSYKIGKMLLLICSLMLLTFIFIPKESVGANFPLKITNIKPAGTGDPPIPETNRIFRSYPGIEYNIRAAVVGGVYPYTYELSGEPSGMAIDPDTGEITWADPQSDTGTVTLTVTDEEGTVETAKWSIDVTSDGFLFVDASANSNGDGTKDNPYNSLTNMLTDTLDAGQGHDMVYFRSGTYDMVDHNSGSDNILRIDDNPTNWLSHPGEEVVLQGSSDAGKAYRINPMGKSIYFDGLIFKDVVGYGITLHGKPNYYTIRKCVFDGLTPADDANRNYGFIYTSDGGSDTYYSVIQDNEFTDWHGAAAIGSLYRDRYLLIENNYIHTPSTDAEPEGIGPTMALALKAHLDYLTVRGNEVQMGSVGSVFDGSVNCFFNLEYIDICFNFFNHDSTSNNRIMLNSQNHSEGPNTNHKFYRNTWKANEGFFRFDPCGQGPFTIDSNVLIFENNQLERDCVTYTNNLEGTDSDNIINSNGELTEDYSEYVGSIGHQIEGQGDTIDNELESPYNLKVSE